MVTITILGLLLILLVVLRVWRWRERRIHPSDGAPYWAGDAEPVQFPIALENTFLKVMTRLLLGGAMAGNAVILGLFVAGTVDWVDALTMGLIANVSPVGVLWGLRRAQQGVAELRTTHLVVQTRGGRQVYRWEDIADVQVTTMEDSSPLESLLVRAVGLDADEPVVKLRLKRSVRVGLLPLRSPDYGTDVFGIPSLLVRTVYLYVQDPDGFAAQARRFRTT